MKKILTMLTILCSLLIIKNVSAGTLSWKNSKRLSPNTFEFYLEAEDLKLNYISGEWNVENGRIIEITMNDGWINTTGNNNQFYYYHNGIKNGNYRIATIKIELTKDGTTKIQNLQMDTHTCSQDHLNNYFDPNGQITNENNYKKLCFNNDNTLRNLIISNGTLSPEFQSKIEFYQTTVEYNTDKIIFTPLLNNTKSKIISDNTCHLNVGQNNCKIIVEAENGDQKTYTVEVTRKEETQNPTPTPSDDATLKSLSISNGILSPSFDSNVFSYTTKVNNNIESITWEAIPNHSKANVLITSCALEVGENTCEIIVEAENKTRKTYYLFVTRENKIDNDKDNDTTIKDLIIQNGKLSTAFDSNIKEYTIEVEEHTKTIIFQYTMNANNQKYTISYQIDPNKPYYDLVVTSLNNQKKETYRFNINFIKNGNSNLGTDSKPEDNNNQSDSNSKNDFEIENPQTGITFNFKEILALITLMIIGIICFKKKNTIKKL